MWTWIRERYFCFDGRIDRPTFFLRYASLYLLIFVPATFAVFLVQVSKWDSATQDAIMPLIFIFTAGLIFGGTAPLIVRRFHDFGFPGYAVVVYYAFGAFIGILRAIALYGALDVEVIAGRETVGALMAHGELNVWLLLWYLPALAWAMTPFLVPGNKHFNRFGQRSDTRAERRMRMSSNRPASVPASI